MLFETLNPTKKEGEGKYTSPPHSEQAFSVTLKRIGNFL